MWDKSEVAAVAGVVGAVIGGSAVYLYMRPRPVPVLSTGQQGPIYGGIPALGATVSGDTPATQALGISATSGPPVGTRPGGEVSGITLETFPRSADSRWLSIVRPLVVTLDDVGSWGSVAGRLPDPYPQVVAEVQFLNDRFGPSAPLRWTDFDIEEFRYGNGMTAFRTTVPGMSDSPTMNVYVRSTGIDRGAVLEALVKLKRAAMLQRASGSSGTSGMGRAVPVGSSSAPPVIPGARATPASSSSGPPVVPGSRATPVRANDKPELIPGARATPAKANPLFTAPLLGAFLPGNQSSSRPSTPASTTPRVVAGVTIAPARGPSGFEVFTALRRPAKVISNSGNVPGHAGFCFVTVENLNGGLVTGEMDCTLANNSR